MKTLIRVLMAAMVASLLLTGNAMADQTPISTILSWDGNDAQHLLTVEEGILDRLYGLENLTRIDDLNDQTWSMAMFPEPKGDGIQATATVKYAGNNENFGVIINGVFNSLFNIPAGTGGNFDNSWPGLQNYSYTGSITIGASQEFYFADESDGTMWSSLPSMNQNGEDHMVTWLITGNAGGHDKNIVGNYVVAFEDLPLRGTDRDYNDIVVEVSTTPEPATLLLLGFGLIGVVSLRKKFGKK
jgi:hypothetical protein